MLNLNNIKKTALLISTIVGVSIFSSNSINANAAVNSTPIGIITSDNVAYGKNAGLTDPFLLQNENVKDIVIEGNRIGIITKDDVAYVKDSFESKVWERQTGECKKLILDGNKVGLLMKDGRAYIKEGFSYQTEGVYQGNNIADMVIDGNRVGIIKNDDTTHIKNDINSQSWTRLSEGWIKQLVIENNHTGWITKDNVATVDGIRQTGDAKQLELDGGRVGVVLNNDISYWKDGVSTTEWNTLKSDTKEISLYQNNIIVLQNNGQAYANNTLQSSYAIKIAGAEKPVNSTIVPPVVPPTITAQQKVINEAEKYLGVPYVWGGTTPNGFDCSGFTQYVFNKFGVYLPRVTTAQVGYGSYVSYENLQKGDLVFFDNTYVGPNPTHVGIYVGNGTMIHAGDNGVEYKNITSSYWREHYSSARRVL